MCRPHSCIPFSRQRFYSFAGVPVRDIFVALANEQPHPERIDVDQLMREKRAIVEERRKTSVPGRIDCVCEIVLANHGKIPMAIASSGIRAHVVEGRGGGD